MYNKSVFVTEFIFCSDLKSTVKIPLTFCGGNQGDITFLVDVQKDVIPSALCSF